MVVSSSATTAGARRSTFSNGSNTSTAPVHAINRSLHVIGPTNPATSPPILAQTCIQPAVQASNKNFLHSVAKHGTNSSFTSSPVVRSELAPSLASPNLWSSSDVRASNSSSSLSSVTAPGESSSCQTSVLSTASNAISTHNAVVPHSTAWSTGGAPALNTELRAKARRQREASRDKGRDKLFVAPLHHQIQTHTAAPAQSVPIGAGVGVATLDEKFSDPASSTTTVIDSGTTTSTSTSITSLSSALAQQQLFHHRHQTDAIHASSNSHQSRKASPRVGLVKVNSGNMSNIHNSHQGGHTAVAPAAARTTASQKAGQSTHHLRQQGVSSGNAHRVPSAQSVIEAPTRSARHNAVPPIKAHSEAEGAAFEGVPASFKGFEHMLARIPSPPIAGDGRPDENVTQSTLFVRQYYALLEKCQAWQRYATTMKERADHLEIENRFLRESSRKNEDEVRALERQLRGLKETAMLLDEERRRTESRIGSYNDFERARQPSRQQYALASAEARHTAGLMAVTDIPSPPGLANQYNGVFSSGSSNAAQSLLSAAGLSALRPPSRSSNMRSEDETSPSAAFSNVDHIHLQEAGKVAHPFDGIDVQAHYKHANAASFAAQEHLVNHQRQESVHLAELLAQDAARRDTSNLHGAAVAATTTTTTTASAAHQALIRGGRMGMTESRSFPTCDVIPSAALTTQLLAAHTREHNAMAAMNRLPSSTSAPVLRAKAKTQSPGHQTQQMTSIQATSTSSHQPNLRHQVSEGSAMISHRRREESMTSGPPPVSDSATFGLGLQNAADLEEQLGKLTMATETGRLSAVPGSRSASAQSDARTVTEDYLQGMVEQKRQLRKISLSQQQQMHFLQARVQVNRSKSSLAAQSHGTSSAGDQMQSSDVNDENVQPPLSAPLPYSSGGGLDSRPGSRLSSNGNRRRPRSRAGSYSFHDAIPIDKDDVFSSQKPSFAGEQMARRGLKRSESAPLGQLNLNGRSGAVSALELRHYTDDMIDAEDRNPQAQQHQHVEDRATFGSIDADGGFVEPIVQSNDTGEGSVSGVSRSSSNENMGIRSEVDRQDNDPKGAHRRLYIRLREELDATELVRFERYVHRYDALQIEMEGAKGIINRVRRLLLPEEVVRAKHSHRDRYQFRKELAREFERIVRDDAVPTEVSAVQQHQAQRPSAAMRSPPTHAFV